MPEDSGKTPAEVAVGSVDPFSNVIKQSGEFVKNIYIEQRLPALILILIIVSLVTVILSSSSEKTRLFLWFITIPLLLILTFFVLPRQGKEVQSIKQRNKELTDENVELKSTHSSWNNKLQQVRDQITELSSNSLGYLANIERSLDDIKSQINEFLTSKEVENSDKQLRELDEEISCLLDYVKLKKQEIDGLQARISGAERVLQSSEQAAKFFAALQDNIESEKNINN